MGGRKTLRQSMGQALADLIRNAVPVNFESARQARRGLDGYVALLALIAVDGNVSAVELKLRCIHADNGWTDFDSLAGSKIVEAGGSRAITTRAPQDRPSTASFRKK